MSPSLSRSLALAGLLAALPALATPPTSLAQLPVHPGARPAQLEEGEWEESTLQGATAKPQVKAYLVDAAIEDVTRWYAQQLGVRVEEHHDPDENPKPGTVSRVSSDVYPHSVEDSDDGAGHLIMSAAQKKALLVKCRPAYKSGEWTSSASFDWLRLNANGSRNSYGVYLSDAGLDNDWKRCVKRTRIVLVMETSQSDDEAEAARDRESEAQLAAAQKELGTRPPTEKELGLPLYPGARYDARNSAGMSMGDQRGFLFVTDDAPEKVVRFYEAKLGKKALGDAKTGYMIALKGKGLVPEEGLAVQPNMLQGGGKTLITVMRQKQ